MEAEVETIEKKNEEQQRQIELQEKLEALNRAKTQRNVREYNAETGKFEWVANRKDIETAQREYDEALKEEETRKYMENAFRDGAVKTTGTDIDKLMPPVSRFGGGNRTAKKQGVVEKLKAFFEKYFGIV